MKQIHQLLRLGAINLLFFAGIVGNAHALVFQDTVNFPEKTLAQDSTSGNYVDFIYQHSLNALNLSQVILTSGHLKLEHTENSNEGPRTEIWAILTEAGNDIGLLGTSLSKKIEDSWILSQTVLDEITNSTNNIFKIGLSELTAFNGEKITIFKSTLTLDYSIPHEETPVIPEANTLFYLVAGLGCMTTWPKRNNATWKI